MSSFVSRWDRLWPARWRTPRGLAVRGWLLRAAASVLAVWALLWLLAPLARAPLERAASSALGRAVQIGSLSLRPWSLTLVLQDVRVAHAQAAAAADTPQLSIDRVAVNAAARSLLLLAPVVDSLEIDHPALVLRHRGDGHYDVDDLLERWLAPQTPPAQGPARFALYNLALRGGSVRFADDAVDQVHRVEDLTVQLPFVSTLGTAREVRIAPRLAFTLDGSRFDTAAEAQPFAPQQRTEARIRWDGVDLAPYLPYWPATLPVRPQAARLDADLTLTFEDRTPALLQVQGTLQVRDLDLRTRDGAPLLTHERLTLAFEDLRPLEAQARIGSLEWTAPVLHLRRDAQGQLAGLPAASAAPASTAVGPAPATTARSAWQVAVRDARIAGGTLHWRDESVAPAAELSLREVALHLRDADSLGRSRAMLEASATLPQGRVQIQGQGQPQALALQATLQDVGIAQAQPYLAAWFDGRWSGRVGGTLGLQWQGATPPDGTAPVAAARSASAPASAAPAPPAAPGWVLTATPLVVQDLAFEHAGRPALALARLDIKGLRADGGARTLAVERIALQAPQLQAERDAQGHWMAERWWRAAAAPPGPAPAATDPPTPLAAASGPASAPAGAATPPAWQWRVARLEIARGRFGLRDAAAVRPVALQLSDLQASAGALDAQSPAPATVRLVTRVTHGDAPAGRLSYDGTLALAPQLALAGRVVARQWPLQALDGYLAQHLALQLERAEGGFAGDVAVALRPQGLEATASGDLLIDRLRARTTQVFSARTADEVGDELLAWSSLNLQGLRWQQAPGAVPQLSVRATTLSDFYARVAINEQGQLNLAQLRQPPRDGPPEPTTAPALAAASAAAPVAAPAASAASAPAGAGPAPAVALSFGPVSLVQGHVRFSDDYIRPAYAAELTGLTGRLGAFDNTGTLPPAELELRGRAEGTAALEITGQLKPLAEPMALDIRGRVRDLELPPLSPYSVKYAGHGIERGKLSLDVAYEVLPSGELRARNKLVLRQLTFGEPVAGAPASLPVRLAAALLADRNGVIDIELPVSGSLKDPAFSIGPVVARLLGGVLRKALTAPFSLLMGGAAGGDTSQGVVAFAPGSAQPGDAAREQVRTMAEALAQRPQVQLTITGIALAQAERDALQRARLERRLLQEKRRQSPEDESPVQASERSALLRALYLRSDVPKPRTLLGLPKELPDADMETLLRTHERVDEAALRELAAQRAQAVRQLLVERGLADERIFVAAPRAVDGTSEGGPRAELSVATQ